MNTRSQSTVVVEDGLSILDAAEEILEAASGPLSPSQIADEGLEMGLFQVPRFRTKGYLTQRIQSTLHNNAEYSADPRVKRPRKGKYDLAWY